MRRNPRTERGQGPSGPTDSGDDAAPGPATRGRRERRSLFGEILDWVLAPLLLLWPISLGLTWLVAQGVAQTPFDNALLQLARGTGSALVDETAAAPGLGANAWAGWRPTHADDVRIQILSAQGRLLAGDASIPMPVGTDMPSLLYGSAPEPQLRDAAFAGIALRVAAVAADLRSGERVLIQVAEPLDKRSKLAVDIVKGVMLPQFVVLPVAVLLVWMALARGISPLSELQQRIRARDSSDLSPISEHEAPEELAGVVRALNELLGRLGRSIALQKQFLADAAHQLKTPLAGLNTQAELAQRELAQQPFDAAMVHRSIEHIARSSLHAAHMVNQLLAMARAEDHELAQRMQPLDLTALAKDVLHDFVPKSLERGIDLGLEGNPSNLAGGRRDGQGPLLIRGNPVLLRELVANLVDNALKYTPRGGSVTVRVLEDPFGQVVVLQVEDSGPGIPVAEREQVFQPFYRVLGSGVEGSGLGLAIVREIARSHRAELSVEQADGRWRGPTQGPGGPGALFTLRFAAFNPGSDPQYPQTIASDRSVASGPAALGNRHQDT
jgi:two-component system sensor histidine kinase TctE